MSLFKSASIVSALTLVSRITGLVRELLIASTFGASALTDAFNVAFRIPNLFRRLFAEGAFSQAFVPVLAASRQKNGDEATHVLMNQAATVLAWALLVTSVLGVLGAPVLVWLMASGLQSSAQGFDVAVVMTRWMFPYIAFMSLVALAAGVLNTWKQFAVPAATPVLLNVCMIGAAWWGAPWFATLGLTPIYALAGGVLMGGVMQLAVQLLALRRLHLLPRIGLSLQALRAAWHGEGVQRILHLMAPALLGVSVAQVSLLINTQIASHQGAGSVSWLSYADRLMEFPTALLGVALGVVLMPQLAAAKADDDHRRYSAMLDWGLRLVLVMTLPCALALLVFSQPLVSVLYNYGAFSPHDVHQTTVALMGYGVGLLGLVTIKVLAPGYYARQDIRTPVRIAVVVLVVTQLLNWVLVPLLAHAGLALSIGLGALLNAGWLLWGLRRTGAYKPLAGWGRFVLQVLLACAVLAAWLMWAAQHWDWVGLHSAPILRVGLMVGVLCVSGVLYFVALWLTGLKLRELLRQ
ncbi:MAG: putative peptidoglycan biosynthesis protein MurJ [Pseudomonadota bacterium]